MKWLITLTCLLVIITACSNNTDAGISSNFENQQKTAVVEQGTVVEEQYNMPKEMPDDFDFSVSFGYGESTKNEINTFNDSVTKDLITKGIATAEIKFTLEEMDSIYEKMREMNIMEMKGVPLAKLGCQSIPFNEDNWEISIDGKTNTLTWTDKHCDVSEEASQLLELRLFIQHIVEEKETYKQLPTAVGGYE
ncbi:hypothetical protein [Paenibacillus endoradicis]|uniref:hypothetical protein n=1 Tax=Paenibacillus endoradicis TaxID=2972487 RepID=UPI00215952D9|nr:hypothetical protein [Paenibacillus endoradicis]MCR8660642.1 hypothetical protein [Paenibacillus endoradicis]